MPRKTPVVGNDDVMHRVGVSSKVGGSQHTVAVEVIAAVSPRQGAVHGC